jgi:cellulose synthase/poly-beta-1,6-N-acetylglucosamine synthase-like glycosyltransferase
MACKGAEPRLRQNIEAVLTQSYPNYRTIIVTDTETDAAHSVARSALAHHPDVDALLCVAESHGNASGKVAALLTALDMDGWASDVYAFVDSDALTPMKWLKDIIGPLKDASIGATTGFRWYFPTNGGFWSHVESAWNASGTNLMFDERYNFPWGGAMATPAEKLKTIDIRRVWENAISDDLSLNAALRHYSYRTMFLPQCTVATYNQTTRSGFLLWATRQIALTRTFNRRLWNYGLAAYASFTLIMILAVISLLGTLVWSPAWLLPTALLIAPSLLGVFRSSKRISTFKRALPEFVADFEKTRWADSIASLIVPLVMTYCIIKSARTKEIEWRGRRYKLTGKSMFAPT